MNRAAFERLQREWYGRADALARSRGDRDIETPKGDIRGGRRIAELAGKVEDGSVELAVAKRRFLHAHRFASDYDRQVWELHVEGVSARETARRLVCNRKRVDRAMLRLTVAFERRGETRADPHSLRSEGLRLELRLTPTAARACDHIRSAGHSVAEVVRQLLVEMASKIEVVRTAQRGHGAGST